MAENTQSTLTEEIAKEAASLWSGALDIAQDMSGVQVDAWILVAESGFTLSAKDAVSAAYKAARKPRFVKNIHEAKEKQVAETLGFSYLGAKVGDADGLTFEDILSASETPNYFRKGGAEVAAKIEEIKNSGGVISAVKVDRFNESAKAHKISNALRGKANGDKGAENDLIILQVLERVGALYSSPKGFVPKALAILAEEFGIEMNANAFSKAAFMARKRSGGKDHSSRD